MYSVTRSAVQLRNVSKTFGTTQALVDVSLTIEKGSSVALIGRNGAGKSTLISIVTGLIRPDAGEVEFFGGSGDVEAVGCVYQKSTLVTGLTAAENIMLNNYPRSRLGAISWRQVRRRGKELLEEWGYGGISDRYIDDLDPVERKIIEICAVLARQPSVLLLDEPTAGLDRAGVARLFQHIQQTRQRGVSVLYVSHHLEEIFDVCERAAVLRDGKLVLDHSLEGLGVQDLVQAMVGDIQTMERVERPPTARQDATPLLAVTSLTAGSKVQDISFQLRSGECLGIVGLDGAGHVDLAEILCGLSSPDRGEVEVAGAKLNRFEVGASIAAGIGFIPEDRHIGGYIPALGVAENVTLPIMKRLTSRARVVRKGQRNRVYSVLAEEWSIKAASPYQAAEELSGGNQQKVVLARAVSSEPRVLVLMNPTAGVDIAAKRAIYETIKANAAAGKAVIIVSSDDEDFMICHRVLVMFRGRAHRELSSPVSEHELAAAIQGE
jgi:simple sugar transport system ATP-binding protein